MRRHERRETVAVELWPEADDPGPSLRVTLNYLQRSLQPERKPGDRPFFVRANGLWLELAVTDRLEMDARPLDELLDHADAAEGAGMVAAANGAYQGCLPLWRGEPFADTPYALFAETERARLRGRYVAAALRLGELMLAAPSVTEAIRAAQSAINADPTSEPTYRLLARAHLPMKTPPVRDVPSGSADRCSPNLAHRQTQLPIRCFAHCATPARSRRAAPGHMKIVREPSSPVRSGVSKLIAIGQLQSPFYGCRRPLCTPCSRCILDCAAHLYLARTAIHFRPKQRRDQ